MTRGTAKRALPVQILHNGQVFGALILASQIVKITEDGPGHVVLHQRNGTADLVVGTLHYWADTLNWTGSCAVTLNKSRRSTRHQQEDGVKPAYAR